MTTIEQKRFDFLKEKYADDKRFTDEKIEFLVRTSLTFDPKTTKIFDDGEKKEYQDIDWYYPKGAAFKSAESGSDEGGSDDAGSDDPSLVTTITDSEGNTLADSNGDLIKPADDVEP